MPRARVLIVEDETVVSMALEEKLQRLDYDVAGTAESGAEAIEAVKSIKPDLALMDIRLEGQMDGVEAATIINRDFRIPVIYLTAHADSKTLDRAKGANPAGYLVKPCSERDIKIALEIALHRNSSVNRFEQAEDFFRNLFESAQDWVYAKNKKLEYLYINPAMAEALGNVSATWEDLTDLDIFGPELAQKLRELDERTLQGHTVETEHVVNVRGANIHMDMMRTPLYSDSGQVAGVCVIGRILPFMGRSSIDAGPEPQWRSEAMSMAMEHIRFAADNDAPCLILGEPGVGKSHYARYLAAISGRSQSPFNSLNLSGMTPDTMKIGIFGESHETWSEKGALEASNGGICHLKHVGALTWELQGRLKEFLKTSKIKRSNGKIDIELDTRVVASCREDLHDLVSAGEFKKNLFYRLGFNTIVIPPLRERLEDFPLICESLLEIASSKYDLTKELSIEDSAIEELIKRPWPGNIKELKGILEWAALKCSNDTIGLHDLGAVQSEIKRNPDAISMTIDVSGQTSLPEAVNELKERLIREGLNRSGGNVTQAAKLLGVSRDSFNYMVKALGLKKKVAI